MIGRLNYTKEICVILVVLYESCDALLWLFRTRALANSSATRRVLAAQTTLQLTVVFSFPGRPLQLNIVFSVYAKSLSPDRSAFFRNSAEANKYRV